MTWCCTSNCFKMSAINQAWTKCQTFCHCWARSKNSNIRNIYCSCSITGTNDLIQQITRKKKFYIIVWDPGIINCTLQCSFKHYSFCFFIGFLSKKIITTYFTKIFSKSAFPFLWSNDRVMPNNMWPIIKKYCLFLFFFHISPKKSNKLTLQSYLQPFQKQLQGLRW